MFYEYFIKANAMGKIIYELNSLSLSFHRGTPLIVSAKFKTQCEILDRTFNTVVSYHLSI